MKTNHSFSAYMAMFFRFTLSATLSSGSSFAFGAGSGEVVKSGDKTPRGTLAKKDNLPTPEEIEMGAVKSPYKSCEGVVTVEKSPRPTGSTKSGRTPAQIEWDKKEDFWKNYPAKGCDSTKVNCTRKVQFIPDTHFYKSFDGRAPRAEFTSTESANDFLKRVADASAAKAKKRIGELKKQKACLEAGKGDCMKDYLARIEALKTKVPEFRLEVARYNETSDSFLSKSGTMPMNPGILVVKDFEAAKEKMVVPKGMPDLTTAERSTLMAEMKTFLDRANKENLDGIEKDIRDRKFTNKGEEDRYRSVVLKQGRDTRWIKPQMDAQREKALAGYLKLLADYPELGYVNEGDLNPKNLPSKLAVAIKEAEESLEAMKDNGNASSSTPGEVNKKRLAFAAHTQTVEELLAKEGDGRSCAVANATLNELATVRTKEGLVVGGISLVAMVGTSVIGSRVVGAAAAAGLITETGIAVGGHVVGGLAFLSGAVPGAVESYHSVQEIDDQARDARVGIVKAEDAQKALDGKAATQIMSLLNFQGSGHLLAAAGGGLAGAGAAAYAKFMVAKAVKDAAKTGGGGSAGKEAAALVQQVAKAGAGDKAAGEAVAKAVAAEEKRTLGTVAAEDRESLSKVIASGVAGTAENPDASTLKVVADNLAGMQGPNKAAAKQLYVDDVQALSASVAKNPVGDAARQAEVRAAIADVAGEVPLAQATKILRDPTWTDIAIRGWRAVIAKMRTLKGSAEDRFVAAWESLAAKAGLPKMKREDIIKNGQCGSVLKVAAAMPFNGHPYEHETESKFMACAAPLSTSL